MNDWGPFHYGPARVIAGGVDLSATKVDIAVFKNREDADAYERLGKQIDAWNGVDEIDADGYTRKEAS